MEVRFRRSLRVLQQPSEKAAQVIGVMMDMVMIVRVWRHVDRAHAHGVGRFQVAGVILEHGGGLSINVGFGKHGVKGLPFGFGAVVRVFDPVNTIEQAG